MFETRPLFTEQQISERIRQLAEQINRDFEDRTVDVLCVLKGSLFFAADLIRRLTFPLRVHFMQAQSYTDGTESSGTVHLQFTSPIELEGREVLLIEDILDTGITLQFVQEHLKQMNPKSFRTCVLLDKLARRKVDLHADYRGFEIEDLFVVGYGLDYNEFGRNMPYLAILVEK
jgi:hypoxanthine phosphoribosyltransferase